MAAPSGEPNPVEGLSRRKEGLQPSDTPVEPMLDRVEFPAILRTRRNLPLVPTSPDIAKGRGQASAVSFASG